MQRSSTCGKHATVVNEFQGTRTLLSSQWTRTHRSASEKCLFVLSGSCKQGAKAAVLRRPGETLWRHDQSFSAGWKTNIWRARGHSRLRPAKGRKPLYWINIKLVQLPKRLTDGGGGGAQDVWSECILRSDLSHPSVL